MLMELTSKSTSEISRKILKYVETKQYISNKSVDQTIISTRNYFEVGENEFTLLNFRKIINY